MTTRNTFFYQHLCFLEAAEKLLGKRQTFGTVSNHMIGPSLYLLGFSCECALKAIMNNPTRGHNLKMLYEHLPPETRPKLSVKAAQTLQLLSTNYHKEVEGEFDTLRYPENGSKSFPEPSEVISLVRELGGAAEIALQK